MEAGIAIDDLERVGRERAQGLAGALMPWSTYVTVRQVVRRPHGIGVVRGGGRLRLIGVDHTHDPADPVLSALASRFRTLRPTVVYVEGGRPTPLGRLADSIGAYGEAGLLAHLAGRARVPVRSLEPWRLDEAQALRRTWPAPLVKLFYLLRDLDTWHRGHRAVPVEAHAAVLLDNLSRAGVTGAPVRVADLQPTVDRWLPDFGDWRSRRSAWFDPAWLDAPVPTPAMARRSSRFRDVHALARLIHGVLAGERVLACMGFTHTVMQAPCWHRWGTEDRAVQVKEVGGLTDPLDGLSPRH